MGSRKSDGRGRDEFVVTWWAGSVFEAFSGFPCLSLASLGSLRASYDGGKYESTNDGRYMRAGSF